MISPDAVFVHVKRRADCPSDLRTYTLTCCYRKIGDQQSIQVHELTNLPPNKAVGAALRRRSIATIVARAAIEQDIDRAAAGIEHGEV